MTWDDLGPYWAEQYPRYANATGFIRLAQAQLDERIRRLRESDPLFSGITVEQDDEGWLAAWKLAKKAFPGYGPFDWVSIEASPDKSPGYWKIHASGRFGGIEGYVTTDEILEAFGT